MYSSLVVDRTVTATDTFIRVSRGGPKPLPFNSKRVCEVRVAPARDAKTTKVQTRTLAIASRSYVRQLRQFFCEGGPDGREFLV